jgi:hypothetical protein
LYLDVGNVGLLHGKALRYLLQELREPISGGEGLFGAHGGLEVKPA